MSECDERLIQDVEERLDQLIRLCQAQANHIRTLTAEKEHLFALAESREERIRDLNRQLSVASLVLKDSPVAHQQLREFKGEIDLVIKEVETCIAYLEKNV
ncbi:hypothetical protein [Porphyromonas sp.]|uniref:hypothetical protein n=1 Tax=Porphyromonas sp. TaxID=1924944 RepID=UPI0026DB1ED6|nr:hypothetical protein [Porphyromonas sp.]MDO4771744.1 hypothetical protein [Porphyromonas sp.]